MKSFQYLNSNIKSNIFMLYLIQTTQVYFINCNNISRIDESYISQDNMKWNRSLIFSSDFGGGQQVVFRVLNGEPVKIEEIPYQIALMKKKINEKSGNKRQWIAVCGGSIIGPNKVLTAAHCVTGHKFSECRKGYRNSYDLKKLRVVAGQVNSLAVYGMEGQWRTIKRANYPRHFNFPKHDIGFITTYKNFVYNDAVQPIPYATKTVDYGGMICLASGYGRMDPKHQSSILLKAYLTVLTMDLCNLVHQDDFSKLVCTSDYFSDLHKGDSGGPLVCKNTTDPAEKGSKRGIVVGTVSGKAMDRRMSTFFTRVSSYHKFVSASSKMKASPYCVFFYFVSINLLRSQF